MRATGTWRLHHVVGLNPLSFKTKATSISAIVFFFQRLNTTAKQEDEKPAWVTHTLRKTSTNRIPRPFNSSREDENCGKVSASKSISRGLAALLERDQSFAGQNIGDAKIEQKKEDSVDTGEGKNEQVKPKNAKANSLPCRSVYKVPQLQQVKTSYWSPEIKPDNATKSSFNQKTISKAPQAEEAKTCLLYTSPSPRDA